MLPGVGRHRRAHRSTRAIRSEPNRRRTAQPGARAAWGDLDELGRVHTALTCKQRLVVVEPLAERGAVRVEIDRERFVTRQPRRGRVDDRGDDVAERLHHLRFGERKTVHSPVRPVAVHHHQYGEPDAGRVVVAVGGVTVESLEQPTESTPGREPRARTPASRKLFVAVGSLAPHEDEGSVVLEHPHVDAHQLVRVCRASNLSPTHRSRRVHDPSPRRCAARARGEDRASTGSTCRRRRATLPAASAMSSIRSPWYPLARKTSRAVSMIRAVVRCARGPTVGAGPRSSPRNRNVDWGSAAFFFVAFRFAVFFFAAVDFVAGFLACRPLLATTNCLLPGHR